MFAVVVDVVVAVWFFFFFWQHKFIDFLIFSFFVFVLTISLPPPSLTPTHSKKQKAEIRSMGVDARSTVQAGVSEGETCLVVFVDEFSQAVFPFLLS